LLVSTTACGAIWQPECRHVELLKYLDNGWLIFGPRWFSSILPTIPNSIIATQIQRKIGHYRQPPHRATFTRVGDGRNKPNIFIMFEAISALPAKLLFNGPAVV